MIYAGCDLGLVAAKTVIIKDTELLDLAIVPYTCFPREAAAQALEAVLFSSGISRQDIGRYLATGAGAEAVPNADGTVPDTVSLCRAIREIDPEIGTVLDVGGATFNAYTIDHGGIMLETAITDMCTAGNGILLETMAATLEMSLEEIIEASLNSTNPLPITHQCVVFAQSEVVSLLNIGHDRQDIFAGIAYYVANRIASVAGRTAPLGRMVMIGGVAKNALVMRYLGQCGLKLTNLGNLDPQAVVAYGAALLAADQANSPGNTRIQSHRPQGKGKT